jgi:hypothetical protein
MQNDPGVGGEVDREFYMPVGIISPTVENKNDLSK